MNDVINLVGPAAAIQAPRAGRRQSYGQLLKLRHGFEVRLDQCFSVNLIGPAYLGCFAVNGGQVTMLLFELRKCGKIDICSIFVINCIKLLPG